MIPEGQTALRVVHHSVSLLVDNTDVGQGCRKDQKHSINSKEHLKCFLTRGPNNPLKRRQIRKKYARQIKRK